MKRRTRGIIRCIVASTTVLAGCGSQGQPSPSIATVEPPPPAPARTAEVAPPEPPAGAVAEGSVAREDPALVSLRDALRAESIEGARAKIARYRPLCDKDGYPLVGNVVRKSPKPELQPSALCADLRARVRSR